LSQVEKDEIAQRLWAEGRMKVEPWLEARLNDGRVKVWEKTEVQTCAIEGGVTVTLSNGEIIDVDHIVLATGYKVDVTRLPYLSAGNVLERLEIKNGFPILDESFQTSVPGLFITSMPAVQDFGPYFGFTIAVRASATIVTRALG
jgi:pyruvate/2-oxoglutarate dehydrogenase complex dihydrolipoamide dehydrogenase (E3) component